MRRRAQGVKFSGDKGVYGPATGRPAVTAEARGPGLRRFGKARCPGAKNGGRAKNGGASRSVDGVLESTEVSLQPPGRRNPGLIFFEATAPESRAAAPSATLWSSLRAMLGAEPAPAVKSLQSPDGASGEMSETAHLQRELEASRDYVRGMVEQHESALEELKSAQEELLSSNEEFQSTNEELETAKEELQSANEELATTNDD